MRSRYTAYVLQDADYLLNTWHTSTRPSRISFDDSRKWLGLSVDACKDGVGDDDYGEVQFVARFKDGGGPAGKLKERSRFVIDQGRWCYVDGDHL